MSAIRGILAWTAPTARSLAKPGSNPSSRWSASVTVQSRANSTSSTRNIHQHTPKQAQVAPQAPGQSSNPALSFPCLDKVELRSASLSQQSKSIERIADNSQRQSGPEPSYTTGAHQTFHSSKPLLLDWGGVLPSFDIAFETWGSLNRDKSNVILLHTGLSASSHAHSTPENPQPGWWEKFIGPGGPLDTNKYFIICTNIIGGCYGSTGPSSVDPANQEIYATRFPILTMEDMVRAQFRLLDHIGVQKLYASVGSSMGGMQSLAAAILFPDRVARVVSISGCARSHPYSIAMRHTQRQGKLLFLSELLRQK
jgi:alpha/beta hydrolase fold